MMKCKICSSYAINPTQFGREGDNLDLCDLCYWRTRAENYREVLKMLLSSMMNKKEIIEYTLEEIANLDFLHGLNTVDTLASVLLTKDSLAKYKRSVEGYKKQKGGSQTQDEIACSLALKKAKRLQSLIKKEGDDS